MTTDHLVLIILVGLVAGFLATHLVAGHGYGLLGDILMGILGGLVGTILLGSFIEYHILVPLRIAGDSVLGQTIIAFIGAVILTFVVRLLVRSSGGAAQPAASPPPRRRWLFF